MSAGHEGELSEGNVVGTPPPPPTPSLLPLPPPPPLSLATVPFISKQSRELVHPPRSEVAEG